MSASGLDYNTLSEDPPLSDSGAMAREVCLVQPCYTGRLYVLLLLPPSQLISFWNYLPLLL